MHGALGAVGETGLGTCSVGKCGMIVLRAKCVGMSVLVAGSGECTAPLAGVVRPCATQQRHTWWRLRRTSGGATGVTAGAGSGGGGGGKVVVGGERGEVKVGNKLDMMRGHRHPPRA